MELMATTSQPKQPSPELIFDTLNAYQRTAALRAAIELNLFTAIGEGASTAAELAKKISVPERGARILSDYLVIIGMLSKQGGRYALTLDTATFLDQRSPAYMGSAAQFLNSPGLAGNFSDLAAVVRKGGSTTGGTVEPENPVWVEFARAMVPMMAMPAQFMAGVLNAEAGAPWKVLDIAAGHGMFGITLAMRNPNAKIVALDWTMVLEVAKENAQQSGVADRFKTLPGSAFEVEYGTDYDLVLLTNFLHHFDVPTCE